jgi:transcriptional regulator with XRE-family HTH domain
VSERGEWHGRGTSGDDWALALTDIRPIRRTLAENLRREREQAGFSQEALADVCLVRRSTISRVERAEHEPRISTLLAFSFALEVPLRALLEGLPQPPPRLGS